MASNWADNVLPNMPPDSLSRAAVEAATAIVARTFTRSVGASATAVTVDVVDAGFGGAAASGARRDTTRGVVISIGTTTRSLAQLTPTSGGM